MFKSKHSSCEALITCYQCDEGLVERTLCEKTHESNLRFGEGLCDGRSLREGGYAVNN